MAIRKYVQRPNGAPQFLAFTDPKVAADVTTRQVLGDTFKLPKSFWKQGVVLRFNFKITASGAGNKTSGLLISANADPVPTGIATAVTTQAGDTVLTGYIVCSSNQLTVYSGSGMTQLAQVAIPLVDTYLSFVTTKTTGTELLTMVTGLIEIFEPARTERGNYVDLP